MDSILKTLSVQVHCDDPTPVVISKQDAYALLEHIELLQSSLGHTRDLAETHLRQADAVKVAAVQEFVSGLVRDEGATLGLGDLLPAVEDYFSGVANGLKAPEVYALYCSDIECPIRIAVYFDKELAEQDRSAMERWQAGIINDTTQEALDYLDTVPVGDMGVLCITGEFSVETITIRTGCHLESSTNEEGQAS